MVGWIKLHRKILHSDMYRSLNSKQRDVMYTCLLLANHAGKEWEFGGDIYNCQPGQFVSSLQKIADFCASDVKVQSVRTALLKLERWGFLTNESTKVNRLITICKWDTYQKSEDETNKDPNSDPTKHQQSINKDLTTNKNVDNEKNDNNGKRSFVADANKDHTHYRKYLHELVKEKQASRDQLFLKCKIDLERRNELWEDFISNSTMHAPLLEDDKHGWNLFKKFVTDNQSQYHIKRKTSLL